MRFMWTILVALALSGSAYAQSIPNRPRVTIFSGLRLGAFDPDARAYFGAMTVSPDGNHKSLYNSFIVCLKGSNPQTSNIWTALDWVSLIASHDAQAARINVKNPAQIATANGTLTFTVDRGYKGDGASGYLATGIADNAGGNLVQDSATLFSYANLASTAAGGYIGLSAGTTTRITGNLAPTPPLARVHGSTALTSTIANSLGFIAYAHTAVNANALYRGATADATDSTSASSATTADTFQFLRSAAAGYSDGRLAVAGWGGGMNATQIAALNYCSVQYLTAVGGN